MKYLLILLLTLTLTSCSITNPQNWSDDIHMQKQMENREYTWQGDTLTISEKP